MLTIYWVGGIVSLGLFIYLFIAFFRPEIF
ncbi:MAG: K(+)-transporting ATPase subunit F [Candidatus Omnitrophica bacterium]|nr:K(+)-transporting ATPase subunit F [Candidatus Omnitrophota bacterium]MDE2009247.1 K(+)-transporting ATPase subunit F [Candidatus Omnitrophota bacterium]MDE2213767.1 K(+)-transporting ATPase subunit F [Candidatus Omnitrophota bacterium]MDE2230657.1 K(+)-transporting ATPase subunit F [Candidatus Omnitrophota bacterium]